MGMPDRKHVGAVAIDAGMDGGLGRGRALAFQHLAVEVDHQDLVWGEAGAAGIARRDKKTVGARDARADMAAVVEKLGHDHHARAFGDLFPERGFGILRHRWSEPRLLPPRRATISARS